MPVAGRSQGSGPWRCWLAGWFAILLALAPFMRPELPVDLSLGQGAFGHSFAFHDDEPALADQSLPRLRPAQPWDLGVLARWSRLETTLGHAPAKPPPARIGAGYAPPGAPAAIAARDRAPADVLQRSAVGTARRPTGPPAPASTFA